MTQTRISNVTASRSRANALNILLLVLFVISLSMLIAMSGPSSPTPVFRIGIHSWPGYAPGYYAREVGDFNDESLRLVELRTDADIVRAMSAGMLEAACTTLDGAIRIQSAGIDVKILEVLDFSEGGDAIVVFPPGIRQFSDLKGKRVAVERHGVGVLFFVNSLNKNGLNINDLNLIYSDVPEHFALVVGDKVDAVVTFSPQLERHVASGGRVIWSSKDLSDPVVDVLIVKSESLHRHPLSAKRLLTSWRKSSDQLKLSQNELPKLLNSMNISEEEYKSSFLQIKIPKKAVVDDLVRGDPPTLLRSAIRTSSQLFDNKLIDGKVNPEKLFLTTDEWGLLK